MNQREYSDPYGELCTCGRCGHVHTPYMPTVEVEDFEPMNPAVFLVGLAVGFACCIAAVLLIT